MPIPCVDLIVTNAKNEFLMLKRVNEPAKGEWWFPGGRVHFGESRVEAAKRKLKEECGLLADELVEFGTKDLILHNSDGSLSHAITTIYCIRASGGVVLDSQSDEYKYASRRYWLEADIDQFLKDTLIGIEDMQNG